jgi:hypothetical protein
MTATRDTTAAESFVAVAERCVYDAETVLHAARQSGVGNWIAVAEDRLHRALLDYRSARCGGENLRLVSVPEG